MMFGDNLASKQAVYIQTKMYFIEPAAAACIFFLLSIEYPRFCYQNFYGEFKWQMLKVPK